MIQIAPRQSGIRSGQRRTWLPKPSAPRKRKPGDPIILLCEAAREVVEFQPQGTKVTVLRMEMSITGAWSPHVRSTMRYVLPIEVARRVYDRLEKAGYVP